MEQGEKENGRAKQAERVLGEKKKVGEPVDFVFKPSILVS